MRRAVRHDPKSQPIQPLGPSLCLIIVLALTMTGCSGGSLPYYGEGKVVQTFPHDPTAFTQGLDFDGRTVCECTGLYGESSVRRVDLETSEVLEMRPLAPELFGEGCTVWKDTIIQVTWKSGMGFVYDKESLEVLDHFSYPGEGWGLTTDGRRLILSDGTSTLRYLDPETFQELDRVQVTEQGEPVARLNELEWIRGQVWANVWQTPRIVRIDPESGEVLGWIDFTDLAERETRGVLNGIAVRGRDVYVTGKQWTSLYRIEVQPAERTPGAP